MTSVYDVSLEQMEAFAELGYIVPPNVVPRRIIEVATRAGTASMLREIYC